MPKSAKHGRFTRRSSGTRANFQHPSRKSAMTVVHFSDRNVGVVAGDHCVLDKLLYGSSSVGFCGLWGGHERGVYPTRSRVRLSEKSFPPQYKPAPRLVNDQNPYSFVTPSVSSLSTSPKPFKCLSELSKLTTSPPPLTETCSS